MELQTICTTSKDSRTTELLLSTGDVVTVDPWDLIEGTLANQNVPRYKIRALQEQYEDLFDQQ